jgi:hypothetical protein
MNCDDDNFWEAFQTDDNFGVVPIKFRKFLHREKAPADYMQSMDYYAHGYNHAFERMVMIVLRLWPQAEYLRMPTFFLARHAAELNLKEVIQQCSTANGVLDLASDEHRLVKLWDRTIHHVAQAGWPTDDE